jgi:hypothetical protein
MENNRSYFMRRAAQERSAATHSKGKARQAHEEMAEHYQDLVHSGGEAPKRAEPAANA